MTIKSLHIYPVKGLGGIDLQEVKLLERGMQYDRRWMLVDREGIFISQRTDARMALFQCSIDEQLKVFYKGYHINIDLNEVSPNKVLTTIWEYEVYAYEVSDIVSEWFSAMLNIDCKLVRMTDEHVRYKELIKGPAQTKVSFADGYPYQLIGTASVDYLSKLVGKEIPTNRFRASIVVNTSIAHEEDDWNYIQIGSVKLQVIKRCARCVVVNIDQTSAEQSKEVLKALSTYRLEDNSVYFGANSICIAEGRIKVGDKLVLID